MKLSISGSGPAVVFIHGFCEDSTIWEPFKNRLENSYRVVQVTLPGHGDAPLALSKFTIDELADLLYAKLVDQGIEHFFVIGHSLGGYVALALTELHEDVVLGFGLFSSTTYPDTEEKKKARTKVGEFLKEHGVRTYMDSFVPSLFSPSNRGKMMPAIEALKEIGLKVSPETIVAYSLAMKDRPNRSHLLSIAKPKFVIAGEDDGAVPLEVSLKMIDQIPQDSALILESTGHNGYVEARTETLEFIEVFLSKELL